MLCSSRKSRFVALEGEPIKTGNRRKLVVLYQDFRMCVTESLKNEVLT
jgi:hypothetical protein